MIVLPVSELIGFELFLIDQTKPKIIVFGVNLQNKLIPLYNSVKNLSKIGLHPFLSNINPI